MNSTIEYYNDNADAFIASTINVDMRQIYNEFEKLLKPNSVILDLGCGSGRDSLYFKKSGHIIVPVDPSIEMCKRAGKLLGMNVQQLAAEQIKCKEEYDAIWACASLLHVPYNKMKATVEQLHFALKKEGIIYASWKFGKDARLEHGRVFTDCNEMDLLNWFREDRFSVLKIWNSKDVREDNDFCWTNILARKVE